MRRRMMFDTLLLGRHWTWMKTTIFYQPAAELQGWKLGSWACWNEMGGIPWDVNKHR